MEPRPIFSITPPAGACQTSSEPKPLEFNSSARPNSAKQPGGPLSPGKPAFQEEAHPAQRGAERTAQALNPAAYESAEHLIKQAIAGLLPLNLEKLQTFAAGLLEESRKITLSSIDLTTSFANLNAAETIRDALGTSNSSSASPFKRLKKLLSAEPEGQVAHRILTLQADLRAIRGTCDDLIPAIRSTSRRLVANQLGIRAIAQVAGDPDNRFMQDMLAQRISLITAAVSQLALVLQQVEQMRAAVATLENQCEQVATVTLSANQLFQRR